MITSQFSVGLTPDLSISTHLSIILLSKISIILGLLLPLKIACISLSESNSNSGSKGGGENCEPVQGDFADATSSGGISLSCWSVPSSRKSAQRWTKGESHTASSGISGGGDNHEVAQGDTGVATVSGRIPLRCGDVFGSDAPVQKLTGVGLVSFIIVSFKLHVR